MLWWPSCPPFCVHVTDISEINFSMLDRFLDLKNLCVATKIMYLAHILKKILRILSFGGHLGRILNISISPMMPRWHHLVSTNGHIGEHIYAKTFCADYFLGLQPNSSFCNKTTRDVNGRVFDSCPKLFLGVKSRPGLENIRPRLGLRSQDSPNICADRVIKTLHTRLREALRFLKNERRPGS